MQKKLAIANCESLIFWLNNIWAKNCREFAAKDTK